MTVIDRARIVLLPTVILAVVLALASVVGAQAPADPVAAGVQALRAVAAGPVNVVKSH